MPDADQPDFDDSAWSSVSLPHTWNETDSYRAYINHGGGDTPRRCGIGWYRKHFKLPASADGQKVFLEFDGMRQAGHFYLNGQLIGKYENGVTAVGLDITKFVKFGGQDNLLAVKVDNSPGYREEATGTGFEWNAKDFNPNFGGLNRDAPLIVMGKIHQTLPLYENLQTSGVYVYPENIDLAKKSADVKVEAEVVNETDDYASITLSAVVVDADGVVRAKLDGNTSDLVAGESEVFTASGSLTDARFWDVKDPYLYHVYSILTVNDKVVDVCDTQTGFRQAEFKGGVGTGGVWLNGRFVWLTGYAQRAANDWAGLGGAYPDWMHDFTLAMVRESHGNYMRWMHVSPQRADVSACDRLGIVEVCPAGDKERKVTGRQWDQRVEVMRDSMIFYRNNPSIFFWEAGNTIVTPEQMVQMVALRKQWDPHGGRVMGTRDNDQSDANTALTPVSEYFGVMIGQAPQTDQIGGNDIFRGYSIARRDKAPLIETEDFRDEAGRNIWDDYSPPHFGFKPKPGTVGGRPMDTWHWNSETFCLAAATRYASYVRNEISNTDPAHSKWSAYCSIYFTDEDADGRQQGSYVLRVSGKVDGVRLPKEIFYVSRVMQNEQPDIHIIGHWNYPADTKKTVYVAATHCDQVELFLNGKSIGVTNKLSNLWTRSAAEPWAPTKWLPALTPATSTHFPMSHLRPARSRPSPPRTEKLSRSRNSRPPAIRRPSSSRSTPGRKDCARTAATWRWLISRWWTRKAAAARRTRRGLISTFPARPSGAADSMPRNSNTTNNKYLDTECGINRVAIRSTTTPGTITLTAKRDGLTPATIEIKSSPVEITDGLTMELPQQLPGPVAQVSATADAPEPHFGGAI